MSKWPVTQNVPHPDSDPQELTAKAICGVYVVENTLTGKTYIGSSCDVRRRWACMRSSMAGSKSKAANVMLRDDAATYGLSVFKFTLIQECSNEDEAERLERELIEANTEPSYNQGWDKTKAETINTDGSRKCACGTKIDSKRSQCKDCASKGTSARRNDQVRARQRESWNRGYAKMKASDPAKYEKHLAKKREQSRRRKERIKNEPDALAAKKASDRKRYERRKSQKTKDSA